MRLLLFGCTGFVGRELVPFLLELGHELTLVSRQHQPFAPLLGERVSLLRLDPADPDSWGHNGLEVALSQADGVVNLAGEPIADKRWTPAHRELLLASKDSASTKMARGLKVWPAVFSPMVPLACKMRLPPVVCK